MLHVLESGSRIGALVWVPFCVLWQDLLIVSVPLSTRELNGFRRMLEQLDRTLGSNLRWTYISSTGGGVEGGGRLVEVILLAFSCPETGVKHGEL